MRGASTRRKFARLHGARRVWAISAVHGEARRLARLHDAIGEQFHDGDRIVYLGNYLGYGDVGATIDELLDFRCRVMARQRGFACDLTFLRGAQEEMWQKLLQLQFAPNPGELLQWLASNGVEATVSAYGAEMRHGFAATRDGPRTITRWTSALRSAINARPGHAVWFSALRHAAFTKEEGLLFVHAAVDPSRPLAAQADAFWWGSRDILELTRPFEGFRRVVRGYDRLQRGVVESNYAVSLDGGAGRGGPLIGVCLDDYGRILHIFEA
ncbi:MAG TPA: hypothetical protein VFA12_19290 [Stellaceae bacterium]|nr:hypothetical protein [Stellaceae bacterium]